MFGMNQKEGRIFRIALVVHVLIAFLGIIFSFLPSCEKEPEDIHVFELASSPPPPVVTPPPPKSTPQAKLQKSKPKPVPVPKPKAVIKKPKPKPAIKPPENKKISFDQFKKKHDLPTNKRIPVKATPQPVKVKINPNDFKLSPIVVKTPNTSNSSISPGLLNQYLVGIKSRMENVWQHLLAETDLTAGGIAHLSFRIGSDGTLLSISITRSSGNRTLDDLVLRVAQSVRNVGPPPGGSFSSSLEIPFRVN